MILILIILMPQHTMVELFYLHSLHCSSDNASQESCLGTVENYEHTRDS